MFMGHCKNASQSHSRHGYTVIHNYRRTCIYGYIYCSKDQAPYGESISPVYCLHKIEESQLQLLLLQHMWIIELIFLQDYFNLEGECFLLICFHFLYHLILNFEHLHSTWKSGKSTCVVSRIKGHNLERADYYWPCLTCTLYNMELQPEIWSDHPTGTSDSIEQKKFPLASESSSR